MLRISWTAAESAYSLVRSSTLTLPEREGKKSFSQGPALFAGQLAALQTDSSLKKSTGLFLNASALLFILFFLNNKHS
jgi:hypothetical protein